jgi:receptor protein-tyrosine kinase
VSDHDAEPLSLERLFQILRRRWWVIVLSTVLVGGATFVFSERQHKKYTAMTSVLFQDQSVNQQAAGLSASTPTSLDPNLMATNVKLLTSQSGVAAATARIVGHGLTAGDVAGAVSASQQDTTDIVSLSSTYTSPGLAAAIANAYAAQFIASQRSQAQESVTQGLELVEREVAALTPQQLAGVNGQALLDRAESLRIFSRLQSGGVQVATRAGVPSSPSSPKTTRNTALGLLVGLLFGLGVAFLVERLDRRMKNVDEVGAAYKLPLLAAVPLNRQYALPPQPYAVDHRGATEVFKLLRAYLRYFNVDRELKLLLVASGSPGDGKTTIAHNLAEAAQETGTKTLLLEADLRRPSLARHYGLATGPGLSELLVGTATAAEAVRSVPIGTRVNGTRSEVSLDVLLAGHIPPNPAELLQSHAMADVLAWAAQHYELVVIDTPPLAVVSDAMPLLRGVDGVVLVTQVGKNTRDSAAFLRERLEGVSAPLLGVVANGVRARGKGGYGYGYGYGYYGTDGKGDGERTTAHGTHPSDEGVGGVMSATPRDGRAQVD